MMRKIGKKVVVVFGGLVASVLVMFGAVSEVKADAAIPDIGLVINDTRFQSDDVADYTNESGNWPGCELEINNEFSLDDNLTACLESVNYAYVNEKTPPQGAYWYTNINGKQYIRCEKRTDATAVVVFVRFNQGNYSGDAIPRWSSTTSGKHYAVGKDKKIYEINDGTSFDVNNPEGDACENITIYHKDNRHSYSTQYSSGTVFMYTAGMGSFLRNGYATLIPLSKSPSPTPKKIEPEQPFLYQFYLKRDVTKREEPDIDRDTFKSEVPSKTVIASDEIGAKSFLDLKVHAADARSIANQEFLAQSLIGSDVKILLTENVYPRRDLSVTEDGSEKFLTWNNLPKNQAGDAYAVVYNQVDGAYVINGNLDANGKATFSGFKLRSASTITICK